MIKAILAILSLLPDLIKLFDSFLKNKTKEDLKKTLNDLDSLVKEGHDANTKEAKLALSRRYMDIIRNL